MIKKIKINFHSLNAKLRRFFHLLINLWKENCVNYLMKKEWFWRH